MANLAAMIGMRKTSFLWVLLLLSMAGYCQQPVSSASSFSLTVLNEKAQPAEGATVGLLKDNKLVKTAVTDANGLARFEKIADGAYTFSVVLTGYKQKTTSAYQFPTNIHTATITLQPAATNLQEVSVTSKRPFIEQKQGKTILNIEASITSVGATVLEVLEKSPGVTIDRNGGIALQGKTGVLVMIDDKPTYLSAADLNNLLSSMSASTVDQIELITNPSAKYDASGNAGIINIKTKKNKVIGFNGSFTTTAAQGVYPKNTNSLVMNYRTGKFNTFLNYNINLVKYLTDIYALRKYYTASGVLTATLDQPTYFAGYFINNIVKTGIDYYVSPKTTLGVVLGVNFVQRDGNNTARASWLNPSGTVDSSISTGNKSTSTFNNQSINLNARHNISATQDIGFDFDWLHYSIQTNQSFDNQLLASGGYHQLSRGSIPTAIQIVSGKVDYTLKMGKNTTFQAGAKSSSSSTNNTAFYENLVGTQWQEDYTKSNQFIYDENIHAVYSQLEAKTGRFEMQAGLRYEHTSYNAHQLGNILQKDSAFSRDYGGLFPSGYISYHADSSNSFTITAGRRIDRPVYQTLNPFYFIINKYTYQTGNPFILPQYSWNMQLTHQYKNLLTTTVSYSIISNYFSQLFLTDTAKGILLYSQGNVGHTYNVGVSTTLIASPAKWWTLNITAVYNHKLLVGFNGNDYTSEINQLNMSSSNQFNLGKGYTAEVNGSYTTRARNDLQELLYPTGQLSFGFAKPILKKKGTLKFNVRDIFYTNAMEGLTQFPNATEYFKLFRESRVFALSFTYRFGKAYKTTKRSEGSANEEMQRVGNG